MDGPFMAGEVKGDFKLVGCPVACPLISNSKLVIAPSTLSPSQWLALSHPKDQASSPLRQKFRCSSWVLPAVDFSMKGGHCNEPMDNRSN